MSMGQNRRSSIVNIDEWLDKCSNEEPDSMIYDPDYANEVAALRAKQKNTELESLYKIVTDICTKIGLPPDTVDERLGDIDECLLTFFNTLQKDVQDEYDKLCHYKEGLLNKIQKMTSDLYLPPYVPEDNITLLQHCKRLKTEFNKLNVVREKRMSKLKDLREKQTQLCIVLGIKSPEQIKMQTDIPTEEELARFASVILDLEREEKRRREKYKVLKDSIKKCAELLEISNPLTHDQPDYSESNLHKMSELQSKLEAQHAKNQTKFERLRDKLVSLYERLDITGPERDEFLETHQTCKPSSMADIEIRIEEYEELKKQNIGKFIEKIKFELVVEYERCYLTQEQQEQFLSLSSEASEELLAMYEGELERLKRYYTDNQDLLEKFQRWRLMWKELIDLEIKANDPNRFNNRGGQLLAEERKRKALQKGLPKIEKELVEMNATYTKKNGEKFKVYGTNLDEFIAGCWDELNHAKEEEKRERQRAKMTPSKKNTTINKVAAMRGTPIKRAVAGGSRLLGALSLSEQEFEEMVVARPTSAKRPAAAGRFGR
jgi:hypothetical protein